MLEYEESLGFMQKLDFGAFIQGILQGAKERNIQSLYHIIQEQLFLLVKRRIDQSKILESIDSSNIRFYLKDVDALKEKILKEIQKLWTDPQTERVIKDQIDFFLKNGSKLLKYMKSGVEDILEKGDSELQDLLKFYDCFNNNDSEKQEFLTLVSQWYKEVMVKKSKSQNLIQEFLNYETKLKELWGTKIYDYSDLLHTIYKTGADEILLVHNGAPSIAISYIQYCWEVCREKTTKDFEELLEPSLKYIDVINDKDKIEMNIRTFFFIQVLTENSNIEKLQWLFEYLFKHFGNILSKVRKLLKDVTDGKKIWEEFNESQHKTSVTLISNFLWPHLLFNEILLKEMKIHPELRTFNSNFEDFYKEKFKHRQLVFLPVFGVVEILERTQGIARSIHVNPIQASILLLFNDKESITTEDLRQNLSIGEENLQKCIQPFIPDILKIDENVISVVLPGCSPSPNINIGESSTNIFAESKYLVSFADSNIFLNNIENADNVYKALKIEEAHTTLLQSWIVRILKEKLVYDYKSIRRDVEDKLKNRFSVNDKEFDSSLKKLEEKGFWSWKDSEHYQYVD